MPKYESQSIWVVEILIFDLGDSSVHDIRTPSADPYW